MTDTMIAINTVAPLANVARLTQLVTICQNRSYGVPGMGCFHGRAGLGKTSAGIYATIKFNACHVEALPIGGVKGLLMMIVHELGLQPKSTADALFMQAAGEFARTGRPLIIDEADKCLNEKSIEIIRAIHDRTGVPVIFMGEEQLPQKLQRWERVHSRILQSVQAEPATVEDVRQMALIYAAPCHVGADVLAAVLTVSQGSLRNVVTNLAGVKQWAAARGLTSVTMEEWGDTRFNTGEAPIPRHLGKSRGMPLRRGAAA
jgi:DNA transposition AAA+ family ATPase